MEKTMTKLPEKSLLDGSKTPKTSTREMKPALGELRDYYGNLLYTSIATENGVVLYQTASLNIIEDGPMIAYAAITETLT